MRYRLHDVHWLAVGGLQVAVWTQLAAVLCGPAPASWPLLAAPITGLAALVASCVYFDRVEVRTALI